MIEDFLKVEMTVGKIKSVEDHPNADKLYVVNLDDGSENGRTICAGIKEHYSISELDKNLVDVFVFVFVVVLEQQLHSTSSSDTQLGASQNRDGFESRREPRRARRRGTDDDDENEESTTIREF